MTDRSSPATRISRRAVARFGALLAPLGLTSMTPLATRGQSATPEGTPAAADVSPELLSLVQYIHPQKVYFWVPGLADEGVQAAVYGLDAPTYATIKADFAAQTRAAAEELLADPEVADHVDRLPFQPEAIVAVIGESDTDSLNSWFEILRHLLDLRRPGDGIRLMNAGVSAMTTTQAFGPFVPILAQDPDWIICALGANDAVRIGPELTKTLVSLAETTRNLAELRRLAQTTTSAEWVWLTRMPLDEGRLNAYEPFQQGPVAHIWRNADLDPINAWLREQPEPVVDIHAAFGSPVPEAFQEPDGLHPTLAGHQAIAREFVKRLAV